MLVVGSLQPARLFTLGSLLSGRPLQAAFANLAQPGPASDLHREIHWLAFGCAALLLLLLARNRREQAYNVIALSLLGLSLEYLQALIYHNPVEWFDVRDDVLATAAVFAVYECLVGFQKSPRISLKRMFCQRGAAGDQAARASAPAAAESSLDEPVAS